MGSGDGVHLDGGAAQFLEAGRSVKLAAPDSGRGRCEELREGPAVCLLGDERALPSFITKADRPVGPVD